MQQSSASDTITKTETKILEEMAEGHPTRDIADKLCISPHTVKNHKTNLIAKLGCRNIGQLYAYAVKWLDNKNKNGGGKLLIISNIISF